MSDSRIDQNFFFFFGVKSSKAQYINIYLLFIYLFIYLFIKDNVFVTVVTSIQYRALSNKAADAFYKLSDTSAQIQSYVFDGMDV